MRDRQVLIMDEDDSGLESLQLQLNAYGCKAIYAGTLAEAIVRLQQQTVDLIVADLWMEDGAGERLLRWLREEGRDEPVLMMAEGADYDLLIEVINKGALDLMSKPPQPAQFKRSLDLAMGLDLLTA